MSLLHVAEKNIRHNCQIKAYPDGSSYVTVYSADIIREKGYELSEGSPADVRGPAASEEAKAGNLARAKRRAKNAVTELVLANDFRYFVTLTLDQSKIDRYDMDVITRRLNQWLDYRVRRYGLKYVLVPEHHKDGAVHFHGFFNDALPVVDSGHVDRKGHTVYNLPAWSLGFSTAIELYGDKRAACFYCLKYITKAQEKIGGRWYYSGGDLRRPDVLVADVDYKELLNQHNVEEYDIPAMNCRAFSFWIEEGTTWTL